MRFRNFILAAMLILFSNIKLISQDLSIGFTGGFNAGYLSNSSYNKFLESYSSLLSPLDVKRQKSSFKAGYNFGADFTLGEMTFRMSYLDFGGLKQKFEFAEGERVFEYDYKSLKTVTSLNFGGNSDYWSDYGIIIGMGNTAVESYFKYPNGTKSFASEKDLNGVFDSYTAEIGFEYRNTRELNDRMSFYYSISASYTMFVIEMEYHSYLRSISMTYPLENLPVDYEAYMQTGNAYDYDDEYVKPNALKLELSIGFNYKLF